MIDNKIVAKKHQKMKKMLCFQRKLYIFRKFDQKVFHIRVCLCSKNSGHPQRMVVI